MSDIKKFELKGVEVCPHRRIKRGVQRVRTPPFLVQKKNLLQLYHNGGQMHCQESQNCRLPCTNSLVAVRRFQTLIFALSVTSFIDSLHTRTARTCTHTQPTSSLIMSPRKRMNILWEYFAFIDVLCAVVGSAQSADFARLHCAILGYSKICRLRTHLRIMQIQQMRRSFDENRLHQFFGPDNNWHFYRSKFKLSYRFNIKRHQNAPCPT